jgi:hypothetical protein
VNDVSGDPLSVAIAFRALGAPIVFLWVQKRLQWWQQEASGPRLLETVDSAHVPAFFEKHSEKFSPQRVYRAKTRARFESSYQLSFVDIGLMPLVEGETGLQLGRLIERLVIQIKADLQPKRLTTDFGHWLFQSVFWLVAAKLLKDKGVRSFKNLNITDPSDVFDKVATHYNANPVSLHTKSEHEAVAHAAVTLNQFASLVNVSTESLAYVYENTLVSREARTELGTHSTPAWLVDYVVGNLRPHIEDIPQDQRHIFEPASGHAAFLVAAVRQLREMNDPSSDTPTRLNYLRHHVHGIEIDDFAREIGRLSLTLADIPNPNGWDLQPGDMFATTDLNRMASRARVLLCNPPFEDFSSEERRSYARQGIALRSNNKAAELLLRVLPSLPKGSIMGLVVPQSIIHGVSGSRVRQELTKTCRIEEICLFPDKVFQFSDAESAVVIARKIGTVQNELVRYRRVRESDMAAFKMSYAASSEQQIPEVRFRLREDFSMREPDLLALWEYLKDLPHLGEIANVGQGLVYHGAVKLPKGATTISTKSFERAVRGFDTVPSDLQTHLSPQTVWMSLDPRLVRRFLSGRPSNSPQVVLNYAPVSRGPWRLKAFIDRAGHALTSRFIAVRPKRDISVEVLWAILNSPVANAFVYAHLAKRDILVGQLRKMPFPRLDDSERGLMDERVRAYLAAPNLRALLTIDAEVLRWYSLPLQLETQLLVEFAGKPRESVPFPFLSYYDAERPPRLPLHLYLALPRFHKLIDKKLTATLSSNERSELIKLEAAFDAVETTDDIAPKSELDIDRRQREAELQVSEIAARLRPSAKGRL